MMDRGWVQTQLAFHGLDHCTAMNVAELRSEVDELRLLCRLLLDAIQDESRADGTGQSAADLLYRRSCADNYRVRR